MKLVLALIALSLVSAPAVAQERDGDRAERERTEPPASTEAQVPGSDGGLGAPSLPGEGEPSAAEREARLRHETGLMARAQGRLEDALADFRRAHELAPSTDRLWSVAEVLEALRRDSELLDTYRAYVGLAPAGDARLAEVRARAAVLEGMPARAPEAPAQPAQPTQEHTVFDEPWFWGLVAVGAAGLIAAVLFGTASASVEAPIPGDEGVIVRTLVEFP